MREIKKVIKDYEYRLYKDEEYGRINDSYVELLLKTRVLFKYDLCKFIIIDNLDNYTRMNSFTSFIAKQNKNYYLYTEKETGKLLFITITSYGSGVTPGIALGINHIDDEDFKKLLELEEAEKLKKRSKNRNNIPKEIYWFGAFIFTFFLVGRFTALSIMLFAIVGLIILFNKKQLIEGFNKFIRLNTAKTNVVNGNVIKEKTVITSVTKPKEVIIKTKKRNRKKRERY